MQYLVFAVSSLFVVATSMTSFSQGEVDMNNESASADKFLNEPVYDEEGFVDYRHDGHTYKLWYGKVGTGPKTPVLVLHGGPGGNHHNLVAFQALADERPVIFYDQLGCGKSDRPDIPELWVADRYFDEVKSVRDGLNLTNYHLIGHSWGTTLAVGFASKYPEGIQTISLHSPILSFPYYIKHVAPLLKKGLKGFDGQAGQIIDDYELRGIGEQSEYDEASLEFVKKNVTHTWPLPDAMKRLIGARNVDVHNEMVASGSELNVPGNLKTVDVTSNLSSLDMPILMTCGVDDLCSPAFTEWQSGFAKDAQVHVIPDSAHMTPIDNPVELIRLQRLFFEPRMDTNGHK